MILTAFILAAILLYTEARLTAGNTGTWYNGFGAMSSVIHGTADQPMQYRVFVPWLYHILPIPPSIKLYLAIKYVGIAAALSSFGLFSLTLGIPWQFSIPILAAILPVTFLFDYADCYYEFAFFCLAWSLGQQHLVALGVIAFVASLNRETGVFIPLGHYVLGGGLGYSAIIMGASLCGLALPRLLYGRRPRYCSFSQIKENLKDIGKRWTMEYLWFIILFATYFAVGVMADVSIGFRGLYWLMGAFGLLMLIPARWNEVRVFMPMLITLIPMFWYL